MLEVLKLWLALGADRRGVTALEYGMIAALIAAVIVAVVAGLGTQISTALTTVSTNMAGGA